jgi:flagellar protein FlaG
MINEVNNQSQVVQAARSSVPSTPPAVAVPAPAPVKPSRAELEVAAKQMQSYASQIVSRDLNFTIDEASGETVIKVVDPATDEVVRQIPSEEVLRIARSLESGKGFLVETKA